MSKRCPEIHKLICLSADRTVSLAVEEKGSSLCQDLEIISLGKKIVFLFFKVNHRPWNRQTVPLSIQCEESPSENGEHHVIVLSQTSFVVQFWTQSKCFQPALFQMGVYIQRYQQFSTIKCLEGSHSKTNTVFKSTCPLRQPGNLFHLAKNTLFRWETFTLQRRNLLLIPPHIH